MYKKYAKPGELPRRVRGFNSRFELSLKPFHCHNVGVVIPYCHQVDYREMVVHEQLYLHVDSSYTTFFWSY